MKVLAIDDNQFNLFFLKSLLKTLNIEVHTLNNGKEALLKVMELRPELILLDINMPGLNGFEVCRELKKAAQLSMIPVVFMSASDEEEDITKSNEVGGADYITKPFLKKSLIEVIQRFVLSASQEEEIIFQEEFQEKLNKSRENTTSIFPCPLENANN